MHKQLFDPVLSDLNSSSADITGSAVVSADGLPIATLLASDVDPDRVGPMSAALLALGGRIVSDLKGGDLEQVIVKGDKGYVLLLRASEDAVLVLTASNAAKLGLILLDARRAVRSIAGLYR